MYHKILLSSCISYAANLNEELLNYLSIYQSIHPSDKIQTLPYYFFGLFSLISVQELDVLQSSTGFNEKKVEFDMLEYKAEFKVLSCSLHMFHKQYIL